MTPPQPVRANIATHDGSAGAAAAVAPGTRYGFIVSSFGILVPERVQSEVVLQPALFPMPLAPAWLLGLMNARGNVAPVFDLTQLLTGTPHPRPTAVLLLDQGPWMVGLVVDKLPHVIDVRDSALESNPIPDSMQPYFIFRGETAGQAWWEFDHRACFAKLAAQDPY